MSEMGIRFSATTELVLEIAAAFTQRGSAWPQGEIALSRTAFDALAAGVVGWRGPEAVISVQTVGGALRFVVKKEKCPTCGHERSP